MTVLRFVFSILYTLAGLSAFVAFMYFQNYGATTLGILTAITNGLLSFLHYLNIKRKLHKYYDAASLHQIGRLGLAIFTFGSMCFVYYSVIEILLQKAILPVDDSAVISIIWAFILLKSGLILLYYSKYYANEDEQLLTAEVEDTSVIIPKTEENA